MSKKSSIRRTLETSTHRGPVRSVGESVARECRGHRWVRDEPRGPSHVRRTCGRSPNGPGGSRQLGYKTVGVEGRVVDKGDQESNEVGVTKMGGKD